MLYPLKHRNTPANAAGVALCLAGIDEGLHAVGTVLFHLLGDMSVGVQCEGYGSVPQVLRNGFDVIAVLQGQSGIGMPLWYIKDKPGKP